MNASNRMRSSTLAIIDNELFTARFKHRPFTSRAEYLSVLVEEVGEVAKAINDNETEGNIERELAQVAAVCVRMIEQS